MAELGSGYGPTLLGSILPGRFACESLVSGAAYKTLLCPLCRSIFSFDSYNENRPLLNTYST